MNMDTVEYSVADQLQRYQEMAQIYFQMCRQNIRSMAVMSTSEGEGCSTLLAALAQRNLLNGRSTLIVDLNLYHPSIEPILAVDTIVNDKETQQISLVNMKHSSSVFTSISISDSQNKLMKCSGSLQSQIELWLTKFDTVLIDAGAINQFNQQNLPAEQIAAACDSSILVVLAGTTTEEMLQSAINRLNETKVSLLGVVINDKDNPKLIDELCRKIRQLEKFAPTLISRICTKLKAIHLFNVEV
ncbi:tyrosine-protein kinase family protein [Aliivibrio kagoshimensis]|uniref:tyrosine-protein kinase family protein n=1 Tax=Aliivibrio kagoshimensis TaxID=2910230 RepID=UPI003D11D84C